MSLLPKVNLQFVLITLILVWMVSFPVKGVLFQISLYLLPILVLSFRQTRSLIKGNSFTILLLLVSLSVPLFLSELWSVMFDGGSLSSDPFRVFWRLALFPVVLAMACDYSRFSNRRLQGSLVLFATLYGVTGIGSSILHLSLNGRPLDHRVAGMVSNPNPFGFLMFVAFLTTIWLLLRTESRVGVLIFMPTSLLLLVAGWLSGSRSALLAGILSMLLLLVLQRERLISFFLTRKKLLILGGGGALVFVSILLLQIPYQEYLQGHLLSALSGDIRLQIWQHYLGLVKENPFLGAPLTTENKFHHLGLIHGPHNMYLSVLVHSGLIGLAGLLTALGWLVKRITCSDNKDRDLCLALLLLLCVYCFFNSSIFGNEMTQGVFALIIAMTLGSEPPVKEVFSR